MRIVFMGTPQFAVLPLQELIREGYEVVAVVTQPDRPVGRKRVLTPSPVKKVALELGIPVLQPEKIRQPEAVSELARFAPDLIVTAAYGQILPKTVLELPRLGCINIHASLLPLYRGGAPVHYAIMNGETESGVTIMYMAEGLDTGDMISKVIVPIQPADDTGTMLDKLTVAGARLLMETIPGLVAGEIQAIPQDHGKATYAPTIKREDEQIDWHASAEQIHNHVRALSPQPGAFTLWAGEVLKIRGTVCESATDSHTDTLDDLMPGTVLSCSAQGIRVLTGDGILRLETIQPSGKKAMPVEQFVRGSHIEVGTILGENKGAN